MLNKAVVRGTKIQVSMAKGYGISARQAGYGQPLRRRRARVKQVWRRKEPTNATKVVINQGSTIQAYKIGGEADTEAMEWLQRSLVCESRELIEVQTITKALIVQAGMQIQIRFISCTKFLITFHSLRLMEETLKEHGMLDEWFAHISKWNTAEQPGRRRVWIVVYGVPMHGWTEANFKKIAQVWGRLISLDKEVENTVSYEYMRLLIDSDHFDRIQGNILLQIGDIGFRVQYQVHTPSIMELHSKSEHNISC